MAILLQFYATILFIIKLCTAASDVCTFDNPCYPVGDIRNCPRTSLYQIEALPGLGFDNLRNLEMSDVVQYNYSQCRVTNDGRFLIPDDITVTPIKESKLETFAELFSHWDDYRSLTSVSANAEASGVEISGKFSLDYQQVKRNQVNSQSKTTRVQLRNSIYKVFLQPSVQLSASFKNRLLDIAANLQSGNTGYAMYLTELIVRDYGSHVQRSVTVGAIFSQIDTVSSEYVAMHEEDITTITAAASANFGAKFSGGFSAGFTNGDTDDSGYRDSRQHSVTMSFGGPLVSMNTSVDDWQAGVWNELVAIDRAVDPLHFMITPTTFPELPEPTRQTLIETVFKGVNSYYGINTHHGCTNPTSPNFDYVANIDDGSCSSVPTNFSFGGVFQTCEYLDGEDMDVCNNGNFATKNPLTGDYSCPTGYTAQELHSGTVSHTRQVTQCHRICHHSGFLGLGRTCQCINGMVEKTTTANYQAFWCWSKIPNDRNGYMFGGLYTSRSANLITKSKSCPNHFITLHIGEGIYVCVSSEFELAYQFSAPFAGFFSCEIGNPLISSGLINQWPRACPPTYTKILAAVDQGCEISYCAKIRTDYQIQSPFLPPFHSSSSIRLNLTQAVVIEGANGDVWYRNDQGGWTKANQHIATGMEVLRNLSIRAMEELNETETITITTNLTAKEDEPSTVVVIVVSCVVTLLVCSLVAGVIMFGAGCVVRKGKKKTTPTSTTSSGSNTQDNVEV